MRCVSLIVFSCALLVSGPAYAATGPLSPPDIDYSKICKPVVSPNIDRARDWSGWDGTSSPLPPKELYEYGKLYYYGDRNVSQDTALAIKIFYLLAGGDSPYRARAIHYLAAMMTEGDGMARDETRAETLFSQAVAGGVAGSAYRLGRMHEVRSDWKKAEQYYRIGASRNHPPSTLALSLLYAHGHLPATPTDDDAKLRKLTEHQLLEKIARGICGALDEIGDIYAVADTSEKGRVITRAWWKAAAEADNARAMLKLADDALLSYPGEEGMTQAVNWWERAAKFGLPKAQGRLGSAYLRGEGVEQNTEQAFYWLRRAAESKEANPSTLIKLAKMYATGEGVKRDAAQALTLYKRAAIKRQPVEFQPEGMWYLDADGRERSLNLLRKEAQNGNADAMFELGNAYSAGDGVELSLTEAKLWWKKAAAKGNPFAAELLRHLEE